MARGASDLERQEEVRDEGAVRTEVDTSDVEPPARSMSRVRHAMRGRALRKGARPARVRYRALIREPGFAPLWGSQAISNVGDWTFALAVATAVSQRVGATDVIRTMGLLIAGQVGAGAVVGSLLAGPIADRKPRRLVMVTSDLARMAAVGSLLLVPSPSVLQFALVAGVLGAFGALFQPCLLASVPNVVGDDKVLTANAALTGTFHLAVLIGPAIGATLVVTFGTKSAFALNACSFGASALLLSRLRLPRRSDGHHGSSFQAELGEGIRYVTTSPLTRGILATVGCVLFFSAMKRPVEVSFVTEVLTDGSPESVAWSLCLLTAAWGGGMVLGSAFAPTMAARWPREQLLPAAICVAGACVLLGASAPSAASMLGLWTFAGAANGLANVSYESLLQERTPDAIRGRVFAATESVLDAAYFLGALVAGLTDGWSAAVVLGAIGVCLLVTGVGSFAIPRSPQPVEFDVLGTV